MILAILKTRFYGPVAFVVGVFVRVDNKYKYLQRKTQLYLNPLCQLFLQFLLDKIEFSECQPVYQKKTRLIFVRRLKC